MIGIRLLEKEETLQLVIESERKRGRGAETVEELLSLMKRRRELIFRVEAENREINSLSREFRAQGVSKGKKEEEGEEKKKLEAIRETVRRKKEGKASLEEELLTTKERIRTLLSKIGNILHFSVPVSLSESENVILSFHPNIPRSPPSFPLLPHYEVLYKTAGLDSERGTKVAGNRGYFLKDKMAILAHSLSRYGMDFLIRKGYTLLHTPFLMTSENMQKAAQLADFDEELYKVEKGGTDFYLIATSEQPLLVYHKGEFLDPSSLPIRYAGFSTCFRREAGSHGKDDRGIFRVHQFEKVEQFVLCRPDQSEKIFEEMVTASVEFLGTLGIACRRVALVSGELNNSASIKHDVEGLFPSSGRYRELVSCTNCLDFQGRDVDAFFGFTAGKSPEKKFVHTLNGTLCAVQRTLSCLVETHQAEEGVFVPEVLVPYTGFSFIPYAGAGVSSSTT